MESEWDEPGQGEGNPEQELFEQFSKLLSDYGYPLQEYLRGKTKCLKFSVGSPMAPERLFQLLRDRIPDAVMAAVYPLVREAGVMDKAEFPKFIQEYCSFLFPEEEEEEEEMDQEAPLPAGMRNIRFNLDMTNPKRESVYYLTDEEDNIVGDISAFPYMKKMGLKEEDIIGKALPVIPEYSPYGKKGYSTRIKNGREYTFLNVYRPPDWKSYKGQLDDRLPPLFKKLMFHLFPLKKERMFFYSWVKASLTSRAMTYLVLQGSPGIGKNRLKLVLRALHGEDNSVDGKKSTFTEKFNSQLERNTLAWFDELRYDAEMENVMKEVQNDSISIEKKGVDASRSTKIYTSLVVSNNKPRDNFIAFDARKFVPLQLTKNRLETSMTSEEIDLLTKKVENPEAPGYDLAFIAQIGRWILRHGRPEDYPNLEFKSPHFYFLAHTSMTRWQRKVLINFLELAKTSSPDGRVRYDEEKGFLWSTIEALISRKGDKQAQLPERSSIAHFFEVFLDAAGDKIFSVTPTGDSITGDFWVLQTKESFTIKDGSRDGEEIEETIKPGGEIRKTRRILPDGGR